MILTDLITDDVAEDALDDAVHEQKAAEAASINNDGFEFQVAYLVAQLGQEAVEKLLHGLGRKDASTTD